MTFRIETAIRGRFTVFFLSGRIETPAIAELRSLFKLQTDGLHIVLDLKDVSLIDREVLRFLVSCETALIN
jgi:anti-anti-sigma regulatory factor